MRDPQPHPVTLHPPHASPAERRDVAPGMRCLVMLDAGEFRARCRCCGWSGPRRRSLPEARMAFTGHGCPPPPAAGWPVGLPWRWRVRLWLALAGGEIRSWRLHRCFACGRMRLWGLRPAKADMPVAWSRTWVCEDRAACRARCTRGRLPVGGRRW